MWTQRLTTPIWRLTSLTGGAFALFWKSSGHMVFRTQLLSFMITSFLVRQEQESFLDLAIHGPNLLK